MNDIYRSKIEKLKIEFDSDVGIEKEKMRIYDDLVRIGVLSADKEIKRDVVSFIKTKKKN